MKGRKYIEKWIEKAYEALDEEKKAILALQYRMNAKNLRHLSDDELMCAFEYIFTFMEDKATLSGTKKAVINKKEQLIYIN